MHNFFDRISEFQKKYFSAVSSSLSSSRIQSSSLCLCEPHGQPDTGRCPTGVNIGSFDFLSVCSANPDEFVYLQTVLIVWFPRVTYGTGTSVLWFLLDVYTVLSCINQPAANLNDTSSQYFPPVFGY